ncbi:hypothetical protein ACFLZV_00765 [Candidatus Margulisiibacteriota bacterium]
MFKLISYSDFNLGEDLDWLIYWAGLHFASSYSACGSNGLSQMELFKSISSLILESHGEPPDALDSSFENSKSIINDLWINGFSEDSPEIKNYFNCLEAACVSSFIMIPVIVPKAHHVIVKIYYKAEYENGREGFFCFSINQGLRSKQKGQVLIKEYDSVESLVKDGIKRMSVSFPEGWYKACINDGQGHFWGDCGGVAVPNGSKIAVAIYLEPKLFVGLWDSDSDPAANRRMYKKNSRTPSGESMKALFIKNLPDRHKKVINRNKQVRKAPKKTTLSIEELKTMDIDAKTGISLVGVTNFILMIKEALLNKGLKGLLNEFENSEMSWLNKISNMNFVLIVHKGISDLSSKNKMYDLFGSIGCCNDYIKISILSKLNILIMDDKCIRKESFDFFCANKNLFKDLLEEDHPLIRERTVRRLDELSFGDLDRKKRIFDFFTKNVSFVKNLLRDTDPIVRKCAVSLFLNLSCGAEDQKKKICDFIGKNGSIFKRLLKDANTIVKSRTLSILAYLSSGAKDRKKKIFGFVDEYVSIFKDLLKDAHPTIRKDAIRIFINLSSREGRKKKIFDFIIKNHPIVRDRLGDSDPIVRRYTLWILTKMSYGSEDRKKKIFGLIDEYSSIFKDCLKDTDLTVRKEAISVFINLSSGAENLRRNIFDFVVGNFPVFEDLLRNADPTVSSYALKLLTNLLAGNNDRKNKIYDFIVDNSSIAKYLLGHTDPTVRESIVRILFNALFGDEDRKRKIYNFIIENISIVENLLKDVNTNVRKKTVDIIYNLSCSSAKDLKKKLSDYIVGNCLFIKGLLNDDDLIVRTHTLSILINLSSGNGGSEREIFNCIVEHG